MVRVLSLSMLLLVALAPLPGHAADPPAGAGRETWPGFGKFALALHGGFQFWSLSGVEESLQARNESFAGDGFNFNDPAFGIGYAFGAELQIRFSRNWFTQVGADWTRLSFDDRDRQTIPFLGGTDRPAISISYTSRVESRPLVFTVGLGRSFHTRTVRFGLIAQGIIAPVKLVDEFTVFIDTETENRVESTGVGYGGGGSFTVDYLTETNMTLFLDFFFRIGSADVDVTEPAWDSTAVPGTRRVDFTGGGLRLGVRWT